MERLFHTFNVDSRVTLLIQEVKARPVIWDISFQDYNDRLKRNQAWIEVAHEFEPDFDELKPSKRDAIVKELCRRWKNLRQCYKREIDRKLIAGSRDKKTQYIYFDALSFLATVFVSKRSLSTGEAVVDPLEDEADVIQIDEPTLLGFDPNEEEERVKVEDPILTQPSTSQKEYSKRKRDEGNLSADYSQEPNKMAADGNASRKVYQEKEDIDGDQKFLMSLLTYTAAIKGTNKLNMWSELLQIVIKYYNMSTQ